MIDLVPSDPAWPALCEAEAAVLRDALGPVALRSDHAGPPAVPGLAAKPVIDRQISVARLEPMAPFQGPLERAGSTDVPDPAFPAYPFFGKPAACPHTHHVHVCRAGSRHERRHPAFRDYLRAHPAAADEYVELKRRLAPRCNADSFPERNAYAAAKGEFMQAIEARAIGPA